jgi:hypothetical protein
MPALLVWQYSTFATHTLLVISKKLLEVQFLVNLEGSVTPASVERLAVVVESGAGRIVSFIPSNTLHILLPRAQLHTLRSLPGSLLPHSTKHSSATRTRNTARPISNTSMQ